MVVGGRRPLLSRGLAALLLLSFPPAAGALDSTAADRRALSVTVYNADLALVREVRSVDLPEGEVDLRFMDVPQAVRPETVIVTGAGGGTLEVLEQNYEYDLLSHEKVLEKYVGRALTIYMRSEDTLEERPVNATLLSTNGGLIFDLGDEIALGLPGRIVVPELPGNLIARPTLVWLLRSEAGGAREIEASYLTGAMRWQADYVALLSDDDAALDLTGWVTIDNRSGAAYENAKLKLIAGDVNVVQPPAPEMMRTMAMAKEGAEDQAFAERELFEYHLYELGRPATIRDNQQKQIELLRAAGIKVEKNYRIESHFPAWGPQPYDSTREPEKAAVTIELVNDAESGLGRPLPRGTVRVYKRDADGATIFAGEDAIEHTPEGERVRLDVGKAFDVVAERKLLSFREVARDRVDAEVEVTVRNRKSVPVTVTVVERFSNERELLASSLTAKQPDAFTLEFDVEVPAKGESVVTYRVQAKR